MAVQTVVDRLAEKIGAGSRLVFGRAAGDAFDHHVAAEFAGQYDEGAVQEAAVFEVENEPRDGPIDFALDQISKNHKDIELALDASDIDRIHQRGKIAAILDLEGGFDLDGDFAVLRSLYRLGLRVVQLPAHNWTNSFADSCCAPARWHGRGAV